MAVKPRIVIINYMDGKRDVLQLDVGFSPYLFVDSTQILNVRGRFSAISEFIWHYFPLSNIRHYETPEGDAA